MNHNTIDPTAINAPPIVYLSSFFLWLNKLALFAKENKQNLKQSVFYRKIVYSSGVCDDY